MQPLDEYICGCDHRSCANALITRRLTARIASHRLVGGTYSSEWGFSKLLHWLRHNPEKRERFASAFEHCDMVAAVLSESKPSQGAALDLRHGPTMDVNDSLGACRLKTFWSQGPAAERRSHEIARSLCDQ